MKEPSDGPSPARGELLTARAPLLCATTQLLPWSICKNNPCQFNNFSGGEFAQSSCKEVAGMF